MEKLVAGIPAPPPPIPVNSMADANDAAKTFQIDVEQVADVRPFVPLHRTGRGHERDPIQARSRQHARAIRPITFPRMIHVRHAHARQPVSSSTKRTFAGKSER